MFKIYIYLVILFACACKVKEHSILRKTLHEQLVNSHSTKDWYVPSKLAIAGLSAEQANLKDSTDNHSIGQLVTHLVFWNERVLIAFNGNTLPNFDGNNETTFTNFDAAKWEYITSRLDSIQTAWEFSVQNASAKKISKWSSSIANTASHNAYHIGQIIYIRKQNGWWQKQ